MDRALSWALKRGLRRGLLGGERLWLVVGALALLLRLARKAFKKRPELVYSERLGLGQRLIITHLPPKGHNGRGESPAAQP